MRTSQTELAGYRAESEQAQMVGGKRASDSRIRDGAAETRVRTSELVQWVPQTQTAQQALQSSSIRAALLLLEFPSHSSFVEFEE